MTLKAYLKLKYQMILTPDSGYWIINFPELPGCVSQGKTIEKAIKMGLEAKEIWITETLNSNLEVPLPKNYAGEAL